MVFGEPGFGLWKLGAGLRFGYFYIKVRKSPRDLAEPLRNVFVAATETPNIGQDL
jgi:hypothetical protein